jgi:hypothetical protein
VSPVLIKFISALTLSLAGDSTFYRLHVDDDAMQIEDEIEDYWNGRYLSSGEAAWRIMGFNITKKKPAVTSVPIHLQGDARHVQYKRGDAVSSSRSLLEHYFARPYGTYDVDHTTRSFDDLTYSQYFCLFRLDKYDVRKNDRPNYFIESCQDRPMHVILRETGSPHLSRLQPSKPTDGERFYLRTLLQNRPGRSYRGLRTVNGIHYTTFQEAATEMGLFAVEHESDYAMHEAVVSLRTPREMRLLFVHLLVNDCVDTPRTMWETFRNELSLDFIYR